LSKPIAISIKAPGLLNVLISDIQALVPNNLNGLSIKAIWDTGATGSVITKNVAQQLGLVPTGKSQVHTANGTAIQNTYTIDIILANSVRIQGIVATEVDALSGGCEALIGMDIITLGDFSITNHKGNTCMSFRVPSSHEIDYVANLTYGITPIKNIPSGKPGSNYTPPKKKRK
jgi:predicted aspartyl protease